MVQEVLEEAPIDLQEVTAQREAVEADLLALPDPTDTLRPAKCASPTFERIFLNSSI